MRLLGFLPHDWRWPTLFVAQDVAKDERLLAQVFAAFTAHRSAQAARSRLNAIFDGARQARQMLRFEGEVVSKALPKQPTVRQTPDEAVAFAGIIQQVIGLRRH